MGGFRSHKEILDRMSPEVSVPAAAQPDDTCYARWMTTLRDHLHFADFWAPLDAASPQPITPNML